MKILVIGCGSIGRRHIKNLLTLKVCDITAYDVDKNRLENIRNEFSVECISDIDDALSKKEFDAAFICSPPSYHVPQALQLMGKGIHCFIEKPLSNSLDNIDNLMNLAEKKQKVVLIGYTLRFSPFLKKIKQIIDEKVIGRVLSIRASCGYYLPYWRPNDDYRTCYGARDEQGGGVVLDISHEIDYVRYFAGEVKEVFAVCRKLSNLDINTEDFAEITMQHENGAFSQIHLDYLQSNYRRSCEIICENGMLVWDINKHILRKYDMQDKEYHVNYGGISVDGNKLYIDEAEHFIRCINGKEPPLIDIKEGKRIQEIIVKIKESSMQGCNLAV